MVNSTKWFAALIGLLIWGAGSVPALADPPVVSNAVDVAALPYEAITSVMGEPRETMDDFALRVAPQLRAYSDAKHFEACGMIASDASGRFGVVLGSSHGHWGCAVDARRVPDGMIPTGITIHSHVADSQQVSRVDRIFMPDLPKRVTSMRGGDLEAFSDTDYAAGPGYLATPNGALIQHGAWTAHRVDDGSRPAGANGR